MLEKNLIEKRFIATLVAILCTTGLVYANKVGAANFEQIIIWVVGLFVAGGTSDTWAQYYGTVKVKAIAAATPPSA
jgi:hypothetical protein